MGENSFSFRKKQKSFPPHPLSEKENPKLNLDILAAALFDAAGRRPHKGRVNPGVMVTPGFTFGNGAFETHFSVKREIAELPQLCDFAHKRNV